MLLFENGLLHVFGNAAVEDIEWDVGEAGGHHAASANNCVEDDLSLCFVVFRLELRHLASCWLRYVGNEVQVCVDVSLDLFFE